MKKILINTIKAISLIIFLTSIISACGNKRIKYKTNDQLIDFKSKTIMSMDQLIEAGEQNYKDINSKQFNPKTDTIRFDNDVIYISYLSIVNGCGEYNGDIEIKNDSIILKLINIGETECTEQRCDRLIFRIKNVKKKAYKILKHQIIDPV